jgi:hypothetical protein
MRALLASGKSFHETVVEFNCQKSGMDGFAAVSRTSSIEHPRHAVCGNANGSEEHGVTATRLEDRHDSHAGPQFLCHLCQLRHNIGAEFRRRSVHQLELPSDLNLTVPDCPYNGLQYVRFRLAGEQAAVHHGPGSRGSALSRGRLGDRTHVRSRACVRPFEPGNGSSVAVLATAFIAAVWPVSGFARAANCARVSLLLTQETGIGLSDKAITRS